MMATMTIEECKKGRHPVLEVMRFSDVINVKKIINLKPHGKIETEFTRGIV